MHSVRRESRGAHSTLMTTEHGDLASRWQCPKSAPSGHPTRSRSVCHRVRKRHPAQGPHARVRLRFPLRWSHPIYALSCPPSRLQSECRREQRPQNRGNEYAPPAPRSPCPDGRPTAWRCYRPEAVTIRVPSGENAAETTEPSCPRSTAICAALAASQTRAVSSAAAVTMRLPSGEKAADQT